MRCQELNEFSDIRILAPSLFNGGYDRGKIIIGENDIRSAPCHISAANAHGNADISLFERRSVIDSITGHSDKMALLLQ